MVSHNKNNGKKFLRVIFTRDEQPEKYTPAATAREWAVPASFRQGQIDPSDPDAAKDVHNLWLGVESFGHARLVEVAMISENEYQRTMNRIAHFILEQKITADLSAAFDRAQDEMEHTAKLADRELGTVLAIERVLTKHGVSETFQVVPRE